MLEARKLPEALFELERYVVLELRVLYDDDPMEGPGKIRFDRFSGGPTTDVILVKLSYLWF